MSYHDVVVDARLKPHLTESEEDLLVKMWRLIGKRNHYKALVDADNAKGNYWSNYDELLADAKKELSLQRKVTLGKIYYSNRKVWKYLTSRAKDISTLE